MVGGAVVAVTPERRGARVVAVRCVVDELGDEVGVGTGAGPVAPTALATSSRPWQPLPQLTDLLALSSSCWTALSRP